MAESEKLLLQVVAAADGDAEELAELTDNLRRRVLELDIDDARPARAGEVPAGAKSAEAVTTGVLILTMAPALLSATVTLLQSWLANRKVGTIKITRGTDSIELVDPSKADQRALIEDFLARSKTQ
jgi:hypothetical protein